MRVLPALPLFLLLAACGMKGDLYETPPPAPPAEAAGELAEPAAEPGAPADRGDRKTIPPTPDPARSE